MIYIFNDYSKLISYNNINIGHHNFDNSNDIQLQKNNKITYPTIIDNRKRNGSLNLYFRSNISLYDKKNITNSFHDECTVLSISENNTDFTNNNVIMNNNSACHNFYVYYDINSTSQFYNKFIGIGGKHNPKFVMQLRHPKKCLNNHKYIDFKVTDKQCKFLRGKNNKIQITCPQNYSPCYANGLYLFISDDGINFTPLSELPFINGLDNDEKCDELYGYGVFDSISSIVYHNGQYILYTRANIERNYRYIKYSISKDLQNWSNFKTIQIDNLTSNDLIIYSPNIKKFNDILISMSHTIELENNYIINSGILLLSSNDGINWKKHDYLIEYDIKNIKNKLIKDIGNNIHNILHLPINGDIIYDELYMYFYICFTYNSIKKYKLESNRLFYITNENKNDVSNFITKNIFTSIDNIVINCNINIDGYLKLYVVAKKSSILLDTLYTGNYYDKIININKNKIDTNFSIKCEFKNCKIYYIKQ